MEIYGDLEFQSTTRVVTDSNGTVLLPAITFGSDLNTGFYRPSADQIGVTTNGTLRLIINEEGAVQIQDTTAPGTTTNKLYAVSGNLFWNAVQLDTGGGGINDIIEDTTPQLGGNLDVNGFSIVSVTGGEIDITAGNGSGNAGGKIDINAGTGASGFDGGDIDITAGTSGSTTTAGGYITILGGYSQSNVAGGIKIQGGSTFNGTASNIVLQPGNKPSNNTGGTVQVVSASNVNIATILRLYEANAGAQYIGHKAPNAVTTSINYTWPEAPTISGQVLSSTTTGTMSWVAFAPDSISDADGNTSVQVEEGTDDNTIRMDVGDQTNFSNINNDVFVLRADYWTVAMPIPTGGNQPGAPITLTAGQGRNTGLGGDFNITAGQGGGAGGGNAGGNVVITGGLSGGSPTQPKRSGGVHINGGAAGIANDGGEVLLQGGTNTVQDTNIQVSDGGYINIYSGYGTSNATTFSAGAGHGGIIRIVGGDGGDTTSGSGSGNGGDGGTVVIKPGSGGTASGSGSNGSDGDLKLGAAELIWPATDGSNGQVIKTDGSANLSFTSVPSINELTGTTTNATPAELTTGDLYTIASGETHLVEILIVARRTDVTGEHAMWKVLQGIENTSGTTALVGTAVTTVVSNASGWSISITADDTNDRLAVTVTGEASKTINWKAKISGNSVT